MSRVWLVPLSAWTGRSSTSMTIGGSGPASVDGHAASGPKEALAGRVAVARAVSGSTFSTGIDTVARLVLSRSGAVRFLPWITREVDVPEESVSGRTAVITGSAPRAVETSNRPAPHASAGCHALACIGVPPIVSTEPRGDCCRDCRHRPPMIVHRQCGGGERKKAQFKATLSPACTKPDTDGHHRFSRGGHHVQEKHFHRLPCFQDS